MPATATCVFSPAVAAPGMVVTATITVIAEDPAPVSKALAGTIVLTDGTSIAFDGVFTVDGAAPTIESMTITPGAVGWSAPMIAGNTITLTAVV